MTETSPTVDLNLLRKTQTWIHQEAAKSKGERHWDQKVWRREKPCGTAFCFAGYVIEQSEYQWIDDSEVSWPGPFNMTWDAGDAAQEILGLTDDEADELFDGDNTVEDIDRVCGEIVARAWKEGRAWGLYP